MKKFIYTISFCVGLLLSSCSPYTLVSSQTYNDANLSNYHTFRIVTPDEGKLPPGMQMVTYYNIAAAIREQMVDRGFTEDATSPLLINIGLTVQKGLITEPLMNYYPNPTPPPPGPGPVWSPFFMYPRQYYWPAVNPNAQVITGIYKEGVLTMDIVNIDKKTPLYSASVATIMNDGGSRFRNLKGIAEAVQTLFSKFPVATLPQYK